MRIQSTILSNGEVVASWVENTEIVRFFSAHAERCVVIDDSVEIVITRSMVDQLVSEVEDFLAGIQMGESARWLEPLGNTDVKLTYREALAFA